MMMSDDKVLDLIAPPLALSFNYFHKGVTPQGAECLSVQQVTELLESLISYLAIPQMDDARVLSLRKIFDGSIFTNLAGYVAQPLIYAPDVTAGFSLQQTFVQLRLMALQAINHVVFAASAYPSTATRCCEVFSDFHICTALLALLSSPAAYEALRVAAIESIFIFLLRIPGGKNVFLRGQGHQSLVNCLVLEPAAIVRSYICSALRELANDRIKELAECKNAISSALKLLRLDESADVRALCVEIVEIAMKHDPRTVGFMENPSELCDCIKDRLERDANSQVTEAVARLCESATVVAYNYQFQPYYDALANHNLYRSLIVALRHETKAAAAAARALRLIIQLCPPQLQIGHRILTQFQSLSALLKVAMDVNLSAANETVDVARQTLAVELGIGIALILVQSPVHRQHLFRELHSFPLWTTSLRTALLSFLNSAALDYYSNIDIVDVTGTVLNVLHGVEWSEGNKPRKSSIRGIFAVQEQRVREQKFDRPCAVPPVTMDHEVLRKRRLTFILLTYAVHIALSPEGSADGGLHGSSSRPRVEPSSAMHDEHNTPRAAFRENYSTPAAPSGPPQSTMYTPQQSARSVPLRGGGHTPMFPNPHVTTQDSSGLSAMTPKEREEMAVNMDKYDSSFALVTQFALYSSRAQHKEPEYLPTPDGFVVRKERLRNPWGPVVKKERLKSWTVNDIKEGDLFYFAIPFEEIKTFALETVLEKATRHLAMLKRLHVTTPQSAKGRRWFLHDMTHNVMPRAIELLEEMKKLVADHGGENVRFPLFLFREKEMHLGERALHPGNLSDVLEQTRFYFSQDPGELLGVNAAYAQHVEEKMRELSQKRFTGDERISPGGSEDDAGFTGHGTLSSESDA